MWENIDEILEKFSKHFRGVRQIKNIIVTVIIIIFGVNGLITLWKMNEVMNGTTIQSSYSNNTKNTTSNYYDYYGSSKNKYVKQAQIEVSKHNYGDEISMSNGPFGLISNFFTVKRMGKDINKDFNTISKDLESHQ